MRALSTTVFHEINSEILACTSAFQLEQLVYRSQNLNPVNISTAFRQLSKLNSSNRLAVEVLLDFAKPHSTANAFEPRHLSSICHSIARSNLCAGEVPCQFVRQLERANVAEYRPQAYSNTLWAFGQLQHRAPRELSSVMWAFARTTDNYLEDADVLFQTIGDQIAAVDENQLARTSPVTLGNLVWSSATLGYVHEGMLDAVARAAVRAAAAAVEEQDGGGGNRRSKQQHKFDAAFLDDLVWEFKRLEFDYPGELDEAIRRMTA